jgi:hypothetical protein
MSFLTDAEASLRVARMSLHIVSNEEFVPERELAIEHEDFMLARVRDIASDSVYRFAQVSTARGIIEAIAKRETGFEEGAQALAREFCRLHVQSARDGAFFVFELGVADENTRLYALMKYDYRQALELVEREGGAGLRRIVEAFVAEKSAIQKSAIIRVIDGVAEATISTSDQMGRPQPVLTDYFAQFLQVERERTDAELTDTVIEVVRTALKDNREYLPPGGVAQAFSRAMGVLRVAQSVTEDIITHAVLTGAGEPDNEEVRDHFQKSVGRLVKRKKLSGVSFPPDKGHLGKPVTRIVTTEEGVRLEYNTGLEGEAVKITTLDDGRHQFTITTKKYRDATVAEKSSRAN